MYVIFISNSTGKAAAKVKTVLDSYAIRIGINTWHTPITMEALDEVRTALIRGISRHTSVACYRNVGRNSMELIWIVGNHYNYDSYGRYAPETKQKEKSFSMFYRHTALLAGLAGLSHDIGKMNEQFQSKIGNGNKQSTKQNQSDGIRHEWMSAWLFRQMIEKDLDLIEAVQRWSSFLSQDFDTIREWMPTSEIISSGFDAASVLIATHHYTFGYGQTKNLKALKSIAASNLHIDATLNSDKWDTLTRTPNLQKDAAWVNFSKRLLKQIKRLDGIQQSNPRYWHAASLIARASLILADHFVSSQDLRSVAQKVNKKGGIKLYANTVKVNDRVELNQPLLQHLELVSKEAKNMVGLYANPELPTLSRTSLEQITKTTEDPRFKWQDESTSKLPHDAPTLIFNVAGTGAGKTRANVKIACSLRKNIGIRITSVFNLRTLTLQSYEAYCKEIGLDKNLECACLVGDPIVREINENLKDDTEPNRPALETFHIVSGVEKLKVPDWINSKILRINKGNKERIQSLNKLFAAPVLVSTIDFINAAADTTCPNADQAYALLRLLHSDLIIDELDSYDVESVVAVLRLIHVAACFGRNVIVSSATLSPTLAEYVHAAFVDGFKTYQQAFDKQSLAYCGLVCDRLLPQVIEADHDNFKSIYQGYISKMTAAVTQVTKKYQLSDQLQSEEDFFEAIATNAVILHKRHHWMINDTEVSIGLVRVANIATCLKVAEHLVSEPTFHIVTYHSLEPLARRAYKEYYLDRLLNRKSNNKYLQEYVSKYLTDKNIIEKKAIFMVVATPVEEVGRDHDFDWAIIEPSSTHSIVQTAGRVNRHRRDKIESANIVVLDRCYRDISGNSQHGRVFFWPGNEIIMDSGKTSHDSHEMKKLLGNQDGEERVLDVCLMFGDNKCHFAVCDERAIEEKLKTIKTHIQSGRIAWFSQWFGEAYPLRRISAQKLYSLMSDDNTNDIKLYIYEPQLLQAGRLRSGWIEKSKSKYKGAPNNAWLSPSLEEVKAWLENALRRRASLEDFSFSVENWRKLDINPLPFDWRGVIPN